jgi:hypothetical protein
MITVFMRRLAGAALLDPATYEDVEADRGATIQAIGVVVLASLAAGVGARGASGAGPALKFFVVGTILSLMAWVAFAVLTFQIGTGVLSHPDTRADAGQLLRTLGFAAAPGLLQVFAIFGGLTIPIFAIAIAWTLVASVVAVRQALDYPTTRRAVAVCGLAWLLALLIAVLFVAVVASVTA